MEKSVIAGRYAQALFEVIDENAWDSAVDELKEMQAYLNDSHTVNKMLVSPIVPDETKKKVLDAVLSKSDFTKDLDSFFRVLLDKDRFVLIPEIIESLIDIVRTRRNLLRAKIRVSRELSQEEESQIINRLNTVTGKKLDYEVEHDPELICGVTAEVGNTIYDFSLKKRIERLRMELLNESK